MPTSTIAPKTEDAALLPALEMLVAFNAAAIGLVGLFAGVFTSDRCLTLIAGTGAALFGCVWATGLEQTREVDHDWTSP